VATGVPLTSVRAARAGLLRADFRATDLVEASLAAIRDRDGEIGAFVDVLDDDALREAAAIRPEDPRPLAGIPLAVKENQGVRGALATFGSRALSGRRAYHDSAPVVRARAAGAIVVGTTSMSEFGLLPGCEPRAHPITRNPLDTYLSVGGSSGGSTAAVAAGMVPLALGNDAGGSLRIPAAWCGLATLVPPAPGRTRDANGRAGRRESLTADGFLARDLDDVLIAQGAAGGTGAGFDEETDCAGVVTLPPPPTVDPASFDEISFLESMGRLAERGVPWARRSGFWEQAPVTSFFPASAPSARRQILGLLSSDRWNPSPRGLDPGLADEGSLEPYTRSFLEHAGRVPPDSERRAADALAMWGQELERNLPPGWVMACPTTLAEPPAVHVLTGTLPLEQSGAILGAPTTFTWIASALGWWSAAIPVHRDDGLPASIQILAPQSHLGPLLNVARLLARGSAASEAHRG